MLSAHAIGHLVLIGGVPAYASAALIIKLCCEYVAKVKNDQHGLQTE